MAKLKVPVSADDHSQGDSNARLTLVEYGDYQCPHCRIGHAVVQRLQRHFGTEMRFVYRNFPLTEIHPMAAPAAQAAEFAGEEEKFWEMHGVIFENQPNLGPEMLVELGKGLGLDGAAMESAMREEQFAERIERDIEGGKACGVHGAPTFFINGLQHEGPFQFEDLRSAMEAVEG